MEIKEKLKETGQRFSEAAEGLKDKLVAKLSEENAQTPEQRLKNARAEETGAKEVEKAAKRALLEVQEEAEKLKRYAEAAEAKGDSEGVRKFENAMNDIFEKLKPLEEAFHEAVAKTTALGEICSDFEAALTGEKPDDTVAKSVELIEAESSGPVVSESEIPVQPEQIDTEGEADNG